MVDEFLIPSAAGAGGLLFHERSPPDPALPIEGFWVRVWDHNLSAAWQIHAGYGSSHPAGLFADMAAKWTGWLEPLVWKSAEGELGLRCTHDRLGHIAIRVELRSGYQNDDWRVEATVMAESGQLEASPTTRLRSSVERCSAEPLAWPRDSRTTEAPATA